MPDDRMPGGPMTEMTDADRAVERDLRTWIGLLAKADPRALAAALSQEYLQTAAVALIGLPRALVKAAIGAVERDHARAILTRLAAKPTPSPAFRAVAVASVVQQIYGKPPPGWDGLALIARH